METTDTTTLLERLLSTPNYLSESILAQLGLAFLLSSTRSDPFVIGPLVALYALREADKRAMMLYIAISAGSCPLDLLFLLGADASFFVKLLTIASLALKAALIYPAVKAHDTLPSTRPERIEPAQLQAKVAETVEAALRDELRNIAAAPFKQPPRALDYDADSLRAAVLRTLADPELLDDPPALLLSATAVGGGRRGA